jgi:putative ABC transport system permease protein
MTFRRLLGRNLVHWWRAHLAVLLGVAVGAAVLSGALLMGDSLQGSLRQQVLTRLGWVEQALLADHFFRQELAQDLPAERVCPLVLLSGLAAPADRTNVQTSVTVLGVNEQFWPESATLPADLDGAKLPADEKEIPALASAALAQQLGIGPGSRLHLRLPRASAVPRESLLGRRRRTEALVEWSLVVIGVLPEDHLGSRFSLTPTLSLPANLFLPLTAVQQELRRQERQLPERPVNALLVSGASAEVLQQAVQRRAQLADYGLVLRQPRFRRRQNPPYYSLESNRLYLSEEVLKAAQRAGLTAAPTLVYLVNNLSTLRRHLATVAAVLAPPGGDFLLRPGVAYYGPLGTSYALVAALEVERPPPLGPFLPPGRKSLREDEIFLVDWPGSPLAHVQPGEAITLTYFRPREGTNWQEETAIFRLAGFLPLAGPAADPNLTPQFPGITDRLTLADWDPPFPFERSRLRPADEAYWAAHRTTPKAYITLTAGRRLWRSRFGAYTSLRLAAAGVSRAAVSQRLQRQLDPGRLGLAFQPVRAQGLAASQGSADFRGLFLGFSTFLIVAALLLVGLLFRLNLERRAAELGLLLALGYRRRQLAGLLLSEGLLLATGGALLGSLAGIGYAQGLLQLLPALWPGELPPGFLHLDVRPTSLVLGFFSTVIVSSLTLLGTVRALTRLPPQALLTGGQSLPAAHRPGRRRGRWVVLFLFLAAGIALATGSSATDSESKAICFFGSGALLLMGGLGTTYLWLRAPRRQPRWLSLTLLGMRQACRQPLRSLLTVGLLAAATFLLVAVQVFYREPDRSFGERHGGSGGFSLIAETFLPVYQDLAHPQGLEELELPPATRKVLQQVSLYSLRRSAGEDASCLNLYQPLRPRLLGVPRELRQRGGFAFAATLAETPDERRHPWLLLEKTLPDGALPAFGDATTVTWMLHSGLGQTLWLPDETGRLLPVRLVGLLQDSVFQSELLISEENFLRHFYPHQEGYNFFLIEAPAASVHQVQAALQTALAAEGVRVQSSRQRLATYLAVENTYLLLFQALGGLGLLLGALGLGVVLLRNVWERRGELALLRALGFRASLLGKLLLVEHAGLLGLGLGLGVLAALTAVAPYSTTLPAETALVRLLALLGGVLLTGLLAASAALRASLRAPLLPTLRRE